MELNGIRFDVKNKPELEPGFMPILLFERAFLQQANKPVSVAVERTMGQVAVCNTRICGKPETAAADRTYIDRLVKIMLWMKGGFRIWVSGDDFVYEYLKEAYSSNGSRSFDSAFMAGVYEHPFEVCRCEKMPEDNTAAQAVGRHLEGCRIGFDAGGSDRKVSAVIDGQAVYSEEVIWFPKENSDPDYHYSEILKAFRTAASHMPRVDGIGISSAGVFVDDRCMVGSLFRQVAADQFDAKIKDIYLRAAREIGDVPVSVANDGDVTALAGAMSLDENNILGIAMGTSEAGGFVDPDGKITGWLNELAFVPVDAAPGAAVDEWSGDRGCGGMYFSQDAVIKLASAAGISFAEGLSPADKLLKVQQLMDEAHPGAQAIFRSIGVYLGHSLAFYHDRYHCGSVLLLGRVMSGKGGDTIFATAKHVLEDEYPECPVKPMVPDEKARRVGQSVAAASLPEGKKGNA